MPTCTSAVPLNIHKKRKYLNGQRDAETVRRKTVQEAQDVQEVAQALHSVSPVGRALRALVRRVHYPQAPYSDEDLEQLLVVSLAQLLNEERP